jgi:hypothetical protein
LNPEARNAHQVTRKLPAKQTPASAAFCLQLNDRGRVFMFMRRLLAIIALASLLGSPAAVLTTANCCGQPDCCRSGMCPMHRTSQISQPPADDEERGMHCHAAKKEQKQSVPDCVAGNSCNHSKQISLFAPLPRAVMSASAPLEAPIASRAPLSTIAGRLIPGFPAPPFDPPRPLAS